MYSYGSVETQKEFFVDEKKRVLIHILAKLLPATEPAVKQSY